MPDWVNTAFDDYAARMPADLRIALREVRPEPRVAGKSVPAMMAAEAERLNGVMPKHGPRIVLDERGRDLPSTALATLLDEWRTDGDDVAFAIGGPDGLDETFKGDARLRMRLSSLTLPHALVRVVLAEQLYRAWSILQGHPYHRG